VTAANQKVVVLASRFVSDAGAAPTMAATSIPDTLPEAA
jgi:hypothetical protein